jgi:RecB family exonuclease
MESFRRCRKQYWFSYVSGEEWPPGRESAASLVGNGVHRAMQKLCETGDARDGEHELDLYLRMPAHAIAGPETEHFAVAKQLYENGVRAHESIESEARWAELDTWVPSKRRGINVRAKVDRADRLSADRWQLIDWKTGRFDLDDRVDWQLDIAHLVLRTMLRLPQEATVRAMGWNLRTGQQRVRELTRDDAVKTVDELWRFTQMLGELTEFGATPGPGCTFCDWRDRCDEAIQLEQTGIDWLDADWEREAAPF